MRTELLEYGFKENIINQALDRVSPKLDQGTALQWCADWLIQNPEGAKLVVVEEKVQLVMNMGFSKDESTKALKANGDDVEASIEYLIAENEKRSADLKKFQEEQALEASKKQAEIKRHAEMDKKRKRTKQYFFLYKLILKRIKLNENNKKQKQNEKPKTTSKNDDQKNEKKR